MTGGFGDALTAALDVISFNHELDINGAAQGLNLANNAQPPPLQEKKVNVEFCTCNRTVKEVFRIHKLK